MLINEIPAEYRLFLDDLWSNEKYLRRALNKMADELNEEAMLNFINKLFDKSNLSNLPEIIAQSLNNKNFHIETAEKITNIINEKNSKGYKVSFST